MDSRHTTSDIGFYALAFLIASGLRFINLWALPLTDQEASLALQALHLTQGLKPVVGADPLYVHLTASLFFVFGGTNFLARFWPALAGALFVFAPSLFRDRLGRIPSLVLAFCLAIDPGLLALSRMAGSSILSITLLIFTWGYWKQGHQKLAAALAALAFLSGPGIWLGLFGLVFAWAIGRAIWNAPASKEKHTGLIASSWGEVRSPALVFILVFFFMGALFLLSPKGLAGPFSAFQDFLTGWWTSSAVPVARLLMVLPAYALMPLGFGLVAIVRAFIQRDRFSLQLGLWSLAAFLLAIVYPARQVGDMLWAVIPLWALTALELNRHFDFDREHIWEVGGVVVLTIAILVFAWLDFAGIAGVTLSSDFGQLRAVLLVGALLLVGLILVLVSMGWSKDVARLGGVWGLAAALVVFTVGAATGAAGLRLPRTDEFWSPSPQVMDAALLIQTADQVSDWSRGDIESLPVLISGVDSPALLWLFRNWDVTVEPYPSQASTPPLVVTPPDTTLNLAAPYRGEAFRWRRTTGWSTGTTSDWTSWFVHRKFPSTNELVVLWVRNDLSIDAQNQSTTP